MSKKGRHEEQEHENEERWLISYADFITLLMALFIVLYSMSSVDAAKFQKLAVSLSGEFSVASRSPIDLPSLPGREGDTLAPYLKKLDRTPAAATSEPGKKPSPETPVAGKDAFGEESSTSKAAGAESKTAARADAGKKEPGESEIKEALAVVAADRERRQTLEQVKADIEALLKREGLDDDVAVSISSSGRTLNVRLPDFLLFGIGSAELAPESRNVLYRMSTIISAAGQAVRIEGHTDDVPIRSGRFESNWDLSTARATRVLVYLQALGDIPADRLSAAGYGEHRPIGDNSTPEGRAKNRRVEFVITADEDTPNQRPPA